MTTRSYVSSVRAAGAAEKRLKVLAAANRFLRQEETIAGFSLDAVAKAAGVTRLTVYNQFGSRRGLLEEVFDEIARQGGLVRLAAVMEDPDPRRGLNELVGIFCAFWSSDPALGRLHDAMAIDLEFAQALTARNERRRHNIASLLERMADGKRKPEQQDAVDLIFWLTSCPTFRALNVGRSTEATYALIQNACAAALDRLA
jgi:AcrR family transcriptional regulator